MLCEDSMSNKPFMIFCGPVETVSGYGSHSRDLVMSLINMNKFDIKIMPINWGDTPMNALDKNDPEHLEIINRISRDPISSQPDIWIQCTIPTEFQKIGKYNIGITAGIETNVCSPEWIEGCNVMDLIIVPSNHAKNVFLETSYEKRDKQTGQVLDLIRIIKPIEVLHEGVRTDIFDKNLQVETSVDNVLNKIKEDFCFLFVGHWLKGDFREDRKDISGLIHTFLDTFKDTENAPALVLKTSLGTFSNSGKSDIKKRIESIKKMFDSSNLPNIYLVYGDLNEKEMNTLYNHDKIKAFVSFTKGEGYGRPIAEFMTTGKPVIVSGWSGHLDFISNDNGFIIPGSLTKVHQSAVWETVINPDSSWFTVDYQSTSNLIRGIHSNYKKHSTKSKLTIWDIKNKWSYKKMTERFEKVLETKLPKFAERVPLNLPKMNLNLPKLRKIGDSGDTK